MKQKDVDELFVALREILIAHYVQPDAITGRVLLSMAVQTLCANGYPVDAARADFEADWAKAKDRGLFVMRLD